MTYNATKDGRITGIRTPYLEPTVHHTGYAVVTIKRKQHRVHRYIWSSLMVKFQRVTVSITLMVIN